MLDIISESDTLSSTIVECTTEPLVSLLPDYLSPNTVYTIESTRFSEHATVLFTRREYAHKCVVMKLLHDYKDTRYSQETTENRQRCQLEALQRNRAFSPEIYLGLARVEKLDPGQEFIYIGEIFLSPTLADLDPEAEYALVMRQLPEERNLVALFARDEQHSWLQYGVMLADYVAGIHWQLLSCDQSDDTWQWGTYEKLEEKLHHNFGLLDLVLKTEIAELDYASLSETISWLKETLLQLFQQETYHAYFKQRVQEQRIRLCHGDLKSPNIWILSNFDADGRKSGQAVKVLDAIDFNPMYCNIDIVSDFAMLAIDLENRTSSATLANEMVETYLEQTEQQDECARAIMNYYRIEKAFVGAAISIVYDNLPQQGLQLLTIARERLQIVVAQQPRSQTPVAEIQHSNEASTSPVTATSAAFSGAGVPHTKPELLVAYSPNLE